MLPSLCNAIRTPLAKRRNWLQVADWIDEAAAQLNRLQGKHREKQRATVIALVDARISGRSEETVWSLPETCSRNIYHSK